MGLNEKERRLKAAEYSKEVGATKAAKFFNISRQTVYKGLRDLENTDLDSDRIRRKQKRKKSAIITDPKILNVFNNLVEDVIQKDLPIKWTTKSIRSIKNELDQKGSIFQHVAFGIHCINKITPFKLIKNCDMTWRMLILMI